ncbi:MAG: LysR family transcriptional regulator [Devosia sp.]|uniref:LysR family transcriptional regulator n=1 Tax=Devosia sp. TaxID=1871048 RepID=UPI0024CA1897|nr:LysR family transcriptional regulator [Devosia sp.]UYN98404.1 MAG: LysR family transcriptional regulator [Devosia sp.]
MIMDMSALRSLVAAVETGSISAAAKRLAVSQPALSQKLAGLEAAVGQQLLVRSRSGVAPTPAGELALEHAGRVLTSLADMQTALDSLRGEVAGRLRVTVNMMFGQAIMGPVIADLRQRYPSLRVDVLPSDKVVDIEAEGIDLAVRGGTHGSGRGLVRRIATMEGALIASPSYLDRVGRPKGPEDLAGLSYVQYRDDPEENAIAMVHAGEAIHVPVTPAFSAQHPDLTLHAVLGGIGFAKSPAFFVHERLAAGTLEEVLPGYAPAPKPHYLVMREHLRESPNVRAFRAVLVDHLSRLHGFSVSNDL